MTDLPPPDLLDSRGRMNRIVISLAVGFALGALAYFITYSLAGADYDRGDRGAGRFIFLVTGLAFAAGYSITHAILKRRDKKKWDANRVPKAQIR